MVSTIPSGDASPTRILVVKSKEEPASEQSVQKIPGAALAAILSSTRARDCTGRPFTRSLQPKEMTHGSHAGGGL